jgi:cephalosporin hydroxylase
LNQSKTPAVAYPTYYKFPQESTFTGRRDFCPTTEHWHAADCESTEFEVLEMIAGLVRGLQPDTVIETGSAFGYGSAYIGQALKANGHGKLYSLECEVQRVEIARKRVEGLPVEVVHTIAAEWHCPEYNVGFAFFDSDPNQRAAEFRLFYEFFVPGALVAFHDTGPQHTVWNFVKQLENENLLKAVNLRTPRGIAIGQVRK